MAAHPSPPQTERPRVLLVTGGMGAGHQSAAHGLAAALQTRGVPTAVFDLLGGMRAGYGRFITGFYHAQVRHAMWSYAAIYRTWQTHPERMKNANRLNLAMARRSLCAAVERYRPTAVVSTFNLATQVIGDLAEQGRLRVPTETFLTDFGVHPYWVHPAMSGYLTVHEVTAAALRRLTNAPVVVTGPFVDSRFGPDPVRRATTRADLGVHDDEPVALVVAGAWGVGDLVATTTDLEHIGGIVPVVVCGDNPRLVRRVRRTSRPGTRVFGHLDTMPALMDAADVLVENAGGATVGEAFGSGLPVVTYRPIAAHGIDNAHAMAGAGVTRLAMDRPALARLVRAATTDGPTRRAMIAAGRRVVRADAADRALGLIGSPRPTRPWPRPTHPTTRSTSHAAPRRGRSGASRPGARIPAAPTGSPAR